ncbi:helix-turn-helix transcriptional regulator [Corynebacterium lubricantis]|uniref:helix-turn-helix transcriptional regulator n=1 Tax=Corynebacterium lubricantis TaxID=541095 RepID=UPI0003758251|nr:WYL domain-containing protein [Corynebacterium lubricantis]
MDKTTKMQSLVNSLNLIPYLRQHPNATIMEVARDLNAEPQEIMDALRRLHLTGVGNGPGEMIDLVADWTGVTLINDQGLDKPLRLTPTEANALLLTLESLETLPGLVDQGAVTSAAEKLRDVLGSAGIDDSVAAQDGAVATVIAQAIAEGCQLSITYHSASSDTSSQRVVSPQRLFHRDGQTYLNAWDGQTSKSYRFDRISAASLLDEKSSAPAQKFDADDPFGFSDDHFAELLIAPEATWLSEYWDLELGEETESGWWSAQMSYGSEDWLVRFCLSQADRIRVVAPLSVADEIARRANGALERYDLSNNGV